MNSFKNSGEKIQHSERQKSAQVVKRTNLVNIAEHINSRDKMESKKENIHFIARKVMKPDF